LGNAEVSVKRKAQKSWLAVATMVLLGSLVGYLLIGSKDSGTVHADYGATTETAAAAGARVLPTEPKLKIEPK
jgi:hypothetical protein